MKFIIPNQAGPDTFDDNVTHALRAMGHEVLTPSAKLTRSSNSLIELARAASAKAFPERWTAAERWSVAAAREHKPDVVLCLTLALRQEVLEAIKRAGAGVAIAWWGDTPANMRGMGLLAPGWDLIFLKDAAGVAKFRAVGLNAELLHEAMNPTWHKRSFSVVGGEVVVAGNYYGYRQYLVGQLIGAGAPMALYGPPPPRWSAPAVKAAHRGRYIVRDEKSLRFGEGLACLNSSDLSEGNSLNCRAFEIAGACGLQLIEDKTAVEDCFVPGVEVLTWRTIDDILFYLERARAEPLWAMGVREAGHRRANAHHTYVHRLGHILRRAGFAK